VGSLVVLPSYNESDNIVPLIREILAVRPDASVCVVDDNSPDGTAAVVRNLVETGLAPAEAARLHLIVRGKKEGRGGAVRAGIEWGLARPEFDAFVEMDCDFSHPPSDLPRGLSLLTAAEVAMGCRYPDGTVVGWPLSRRVFSFLANLLARALIRWSIHDYTNGYRFYTRRAAGIMCAAPQRHTGYIYLSETITLFLRNNLEIACFPIVFVNRRRGATNTGVREIASALAGIVEIALRYRFGAGTR
jgi:dolichol-phosphate mannosyltransferase